MMLDIDKVIVEGRIRSDYGNLEELANDIKENGLINPPVVTPDFKLIAGERRYKAMKMLGWPQIEVRIMTVTDALHQIKLEISENENRKDFSFSEKMKWADMLKVEYKKIADANQKAGTSGKILPEVGRVRDKLANDVGFGNGETFRQAEYVMQHADTDMISKLDDGDLSVNAAYRALKEKADALEQKQNEYTTEAAQMAVKLERQVKKNADQEDMIYALKRQGDPDLIEEIDKLKDQVRKDYERAQQFKAEAERARSRAEQAEARAAKDREKLDIAAEQNYDLLGQLEELQDKINTEDVAPLAPVVQFSGNPYTINMLLREMLSFISCLAQFCNVTISSSDKDANTFDDYLRDIVTKLGAIKKSIKDVA